MLVLAGLMAGCHTDPNTAKRKYVASGDAYLAHGKFSEAGIQYANALKLDRNYADAHYGMAMAERGTGQLFASYQELVKTIALAPSNMAARLALGNLLVGSGKTAAAEEQAKALIADNPQNPDAHALLSAIASNSGDKAQAIAEIRHAIELAPTRASFHEDLALLETGDSGNPATVEEELKRSSSLDPNDAHSQMLLATFYIKAGRWPEATAAAQAAVARDPSSVPARQTLADVFFEQQDTARAEQVLTQAAADFTSDPKRATVLADYYARSGQAAKAEAEYARVASRFPKNLPVQVNYAHVLLQIGDYAAATKLVNGLMKKNDHNPQVLALNGIILLNNGKPSEAVIALQHAVRNYPNDTFLMYWLGRVALAKGDAELAESTFRRAVEISPSNLDAEAELARIASLRGDMALLNEVSGNTIQAAPHSPLGYTWRGMVEMRRNTAAPAEADFAFAMKIAPKYAPAYFQLGRIRFAEKKFADGAALLDQSLEYDPNSVASEKMLVGYDLLQKQPQKAMTRLNAQIAKCPRNSGFLDLMAEFLIQVHEYGQASVAAQRAMQMNYGDGDAVMLYAEIEQRSGQTANAVKAWEQWLNTHRYDAHAVAVLGTLEESRGNLDQAETYYKRALQLQPDQALAANNLAYLMLERNENADVALTLAQIARHGMPESPATADTLAWAYYYKGAYAFARDLLEDALKTDPDSAARHYHLGMVYLRLADKQSATAHLRKAISLSPNTPTANSAKAALRSLGVTS